MMVTVCYATPNQQVEISVEVEAHANVALAIRRSGILTQFTDILFPDIIVGIYSKKVALDTALQPGDRIEIYRPLTIDPKAARLLRAALTKKKL